MSTNYCPKTCNQLSVAVILIAIGIIQLVAGIILLKSEDIYLLAGTDFVVAASNVLVGSLLGVAASVWEKKKKFASLKSTARQNVLAGLYISALTMNATAAIVMIFGDGNTLLISKDNADDVSGDFVYELLACAYVTSVCSPIVCLVIALVCLSGNRIQIYENMKEKTSITKSESYGWVYENNHDGQSRNFGAVLKDSSVSDDNVFLEKKTDAEKLKFSKKTKARNSFTSLSELKSPLDIWNQKRNKIMEEITSPRPIFFADDYLQFPDFKYDSCIGTMIPRIKHSSFIQTCSHDSTPIIQTANIENVERKVAKVEKTMSCKPSKPHLDELNLKVASRRMSYPDSIFNDSIDYREEKLSALPETELEDLRKSVDEPDARVFNTNHSKLHRTLANSIEHAETKRLNQPIHANFFDFETTDSPRVLSEDYDIVGNRTSLDWFQNPRDLRRDSIDSGSSGLTAQTISELKAKINKRNFDEDENHEQRQFLRSFKHDNNRKSHLSESDVEGKLSAFQKLHDQYGIFSQDYDSVSKVALAGEVVPISVRPTEIDRANSIPLNTISTQAPSRYSVNLKNTPNQKFDTNSDNSELFLSIGGSESSPNNNSCSNNYKEKSTYELDVKSTCSIKHTERKSDFRQRMPFMGSITESPIEESFQSTHHLSNSGKQNCELSRLSPEENKVEDLPKNGMRLAKNSFSLKRLSTKAAPNLLNRLWSMKRSETKTDLTSLIMDSDSLVGLSDEDLMDRTRRLRQLRKSVELRSKIEKLKNIVVPLSNEMEEIKD